MDYLLAFIIATISVVYSEPVDGGLLLGFVLPVLGVLGIYYLLTGESQNPISGYPSIGWTIRL